MSDFFRKIMHADRQTVRQIKPLVTISKPDLSTVFQVFVSVSLIFLQKEITATCQHISAIRISFFLVF